MIESSMYLGIGLLFGILIGLLLIPLAHARAVRLTTRRLEAVVPELTAEVLADKDLLRAEFAMSTRRLEIAIDLLMEKIGRCGMSTCIKRASDRTRRPQILCLGSWLPSQVARGFRLHLADRLFKGEPLLRDVR